LGTFSKGSTSEKYAHSSYFVAETPIQNFYQEKNFEK
jgi:hypothetical protein